MKKCFKIMLFCCLSIIIGILLFSCFNPLIPSEDLEDGLWKIEVDERDFGESVDIDNNVAVISSSGSEKGTIYIYEKQSNYWQLSKTIVCEDTIKYAFGEDVAVDDNIIVFSDSKNQKVFSYYKDDTAWTAMNVINCPNQNEFEYFGSSIDIYEQYLIVGSAKGSSIIYKLDNNEWSEISRLESELFQDYHHFIDVCISKKFIATSTYGGIYVHERQGDIISKGVKLDSTENKYNYIECHINIDDTTLAVNARWIGSSWCEIHIYTYNDGVWILTDEFSCGDMMSTGRSIGINSDVITYCASPDLIFSKDELTIYQYGINNRTPNKWSEREVLKYDSYDLDVGICDNYIIWGGYRCAYIYEYR